MPIHIDIAIEALGLFCNVHIASVDSHAGAPPQEHLHTKNLFHTILKADENSEESDSHLDYCSQGVPLLTRFTAIPAPPRALFHSIPEPAKSSRPNFLIKDKFFEPCFDYDFSNLKDTETFMRGGEVYERPCGWQRFALKVLDEYEDNTWLGTSQRSTQSVPGEWPVSYHGTSKAGVVSIVTGDYKAGSGDVYGRGVYSTPYISDAEDYTTQWASKKDGRRYEAILQNRINPKYREICQRKEYWLVRIPKGTSAAEEHMMVHRAIRPYGILVKEVVL